MNAFALLDLYCERTDAGLWAEPLNAASNLAFLFAAAHLWRSTPAERDLRLMTLLLAAIGIGSGLFHTFATVWGVWLDQGFIALFILAYINRFLARVAGLGMVASLLGALLFLGLDRLWARVGNLGLNGSEGYLLPWAVLIGFALWSRHIAPGAVRWLGAAAGLFALSITLRTLDMQICELWPWGTHFGWHLCNAGVLYLCIRGLQQGIGMAQATQNS